MSYFKLKLLSDGGKAKLQRKCGVFLDALRKKILIPQYSLRKSFWNSIWEFCRRKDRKGNVKPEEEWPTDEYWSDYWWESEEESDPGSVTDSGEEEEPGSVTTSGDEGDPGSVTDSSDHEDPGLVTDSGDEEDPGSVTDSGDKEEPGSCLET